MKATELIEELDRQVHEFGDGDVQVKDALENWWYDVVRVRRAPGENAYRMITED